jgi:hypothetical protein
VAPIDVGEMEDADVPLALVACEHVAQERAELPDQFMLLQAGRYGAFSLHSSDGFRGALPCQERGAKPE